MEIQGKPPEPLPTPPETTPKPTTAAAERNGNRVLRKLWSSSFRGAKGWTRHHRVEVFWAVVFSVIAGWVLAPPPPQPYTIYIVADARTDQETMAAFEMLEQNFQSDALSIGDVPVRVKIEKLDESTSAIDKANDLVNRPDTLLVIGHMPSAPIEDSLLVYFQAGPPVPVLSTTASDEDLLIKCRQQRGACFQDGWFAPLLQLSPTNKEQGRSAIRFAIQKHKKRFLIVTELDFDKDGYTKDLVQAYDDAIKETNNQLGGDSDGLAIVGKYKLDHLPNKEKLARLRPDCVLYAGELDTAHDLLSTFSGAEPMVILSDATLESRLTDNALGDFTLASFTYQTDAADYNNHTNIYGRDAYWIARQLIGDVNKRGGDWRYWLKSLLHFHSVKDARRNLVRIMEENSASRTWYRGFPDQREIGTTYVFNQEKRVDGMFHVWQLNKQATKPGSEMLDVDNWHPPKISSVHQPARSATNGKGGNK
jgi:hypothetical protein